MEKLIEVGGLAAAVTVLAFGVYQVAIKLKILQSLKRRHRVVILLVVVACSFITSYMVITSNRTSIESGVRIMDTSVTGNSNLVIKNVTDGQIKGQDQSGEVGVSSTNIDGRSRILIENTSK